MTIAERTTRSHAGYGLTEVSLVVAILGVLTALSTPMLVTAYQAAQLRGAAEQVVAHLNQGRQLAILQNDQVCVHITPTALHYRQGGCTGSIWVGPGTDASGNIPLPAGIVLSNSANPVFNHLGAATPAATYTVTLAQTGAQLNVTVSASGRVAISA